MVWKVVIHRSVRKFERRHPEYKGVITKVVSDLVENPYIGTRLRGKCNWLWKLRKGNLRIIYEIKSFKQDSLYLEGRFQGEHIRGDLLAYGPR